MNKIKLLLITAIIFFILFLFSLSSYFYLKNSITNHTSLQTTLIIGDEVGFNLDTDALHFGTIRYEGIARRSINIPSYDGYLLIKTTGNISEFIYLGYPQTSPSQIDFLAVAYNTEFGEYSGEINIYELKRHNKFIDLLIKGKSISYHDAPQQTPSVLLNISR